MTNARPLNEQERWALALRINDAFPEACWAEIAMWGMGYDGYGFDPVASPTYVLQCASGCQEEGKTGSCWCGKFMSEELRNAPPAKSIVEIVNDPEFVARSEAAAAEREARFVARYGENPALPPYRPSNGTEGDYFQAEFCERCVHDDYANEVYCETLGNALAFDIEDEHYPGETWVYLNGHPTCLAFRPRPDGGGDDEGPVDPGPNQLDMFMPLPVLVAV